MEMHKVQLKPLDCKLVDGNDEAKGVLWLNSALTVGGTVHTTFFFFAV